MAISSRNMTWECADCDGSLTIDGIDMNGPAWCTDLGLLYGSPELMGSDRLIPDAMTIPYPREPVTTGRLLPFRANGHWDRFGAEVAPGGNLDAQLEANLAYLYANVFNQPDNFPGTRTAVWTTAAGTVIPAEVHVLGLLNPVKIVGPALRGTLALSDVHGVLHL